MVTKWLYMFRFQLKQKGVSSALVENLLDQISPDWQQIATEFLLRRFHLPARDQKEKARQYRTLCNRGFNNDVVRRAMDAFSDAAEDA